MSGPELDVSFDAFETDINDFMRAHGLCSPRSEHDRLNAVFAQLGIELFTVERTTHGVWRVTFPKGGRGGCESRGDLLRRVRTALIAEQIIPVRGKCTFFLVGPKWAVSFTSTLHHGEPRGVRFRRVKRGCVVPCREEYLPVPFIQ